MAVNYPTERYFSSITGQLQYYGKIGLTNYGGVSQVRVNGDLSRGFDTGCKKQKYQTVGGNIPWDIIRYEGIPGEDVNKGCSGSARC